MPNLDLALILLLILSGPPLLWETRAFFPTMKISCLRDQERKPSFPFFFRPRKKWEELLLVGSIFGNARKRQKNRSHGVFFANVPVAKKSWSLLHLWARKIHQFLAAIRSEDTPIQHHVFGPSSSASTSLLLDRPPRCNGKGSRAKERRRITQLLEQRKLLPGLIMFSCIV